MPKKLYEESNIQEIASTIREKNGTQDTYKVSQMAGAMNDLIGPPAYNNMILAQDTQPDSEYNKVWFDTDTDDEYTFPEIDDNNVSTTDTWSSQKIKAEDNELKSAIESEQKIIATPQSGYVNVESGNIVPNSAYSYIQFSVIPGDKLHYKTKRNESMAGIAFYDITGTFISGSGQAATNTDVEITVPENAAIAKASYQTDDESDFYVKFLARWQDTADNRIMIQTIAAELDDVQTDLGTLLSLQTVSATPNQGYVNVANGDIANHQSYSYIQFSVIPGDKLHYKTKRNESVAGIAFYDITGTFISDSGQAATNTDAEITVPNGAAFCKASYVTSEQSDFYVKFMAKSQDIADNRNSIQKMAFLYDGKIGQIYTGYANISSGSISTNNAYRYYNISVFPGEKIKYKTGFNESIVGIVFYDERGKFIPGSGTAATTTEQIITAPNSAFSAIAAYRYAQTADFVLETELPPQYVFEQIRDNLAYRPQFILPTSSVAVVGHEWNCYFDNVIRGMDFEKYAVNVQSISGTVSSKKCFERFLRIMPVAGDIGDHTVRMQILDKKDCIVIDDATFTLHIIADSSLSGKKVMFIGDSLTDAGIYPAEVQFNLSGGGIVSVGTREDTVTIGENTYTVKHEGRAGWATYDYTRTVPNYRTDVGNPFWDGSKFSFSYYMENSGVSKPDIVCIGLGTNGGTAGIADMLTMVESIHDYDSSIPVLVSLITPPAGQDGCGYNNGIQSAARLKCDFLDVNQAYIAEYDGKTGTGIVDLYFQLDRLHDFPTATIAVSARNPETMTVQANNVHPSVYGYLHFADAYYNRLLYEFTKE